MRRVQQGFTAVELLIAMIVGVVLLGSAYQLHTNVLRQSAAAQRESQASNIAYDILRTSIKSTTVVSNPCIARTLTRTIPTYYTTGQTQIGAGSGMTASATVTCPYTSNTSLNLVTVTVEYNDTNGTRQQVSRAITAKR